MNHRIKMINTFDISPNNNKIRSNNNIDDLKGMIESINNFGIIQPLVVRKRKQYNSVVINGERIRTQKYELICGERRWRSAKLIGIRKLPCIVVKTDNEGSALLSFAENNQRKEVSFLEQAEFFRCITERFCISIDELSNMISVPQQAIYSKISLLMLSKEEQAVINAYKLSENHARELTRVKNDDIRKNILTKIAISGLSLFETEDLIDEYLDPQHPIEKMKKEIIRTSVFKISDIRFFYNSFERALSILKQAGVNFEESKTENDEHIDIKLRILKRNKVNIDK